MSSFLVIKLILIILSDSIWGIKTLISSVPVLAALILDEQLKLQVDASKLGARAVLLQEGEDGVDLPVTPPP